MVFNATISVISWWPYLLVEKTTDLPQVTDKFYRIMYRVHLARVGFELATLVVMGTDCNYHTIMIVLPKSHIPQ